MSLEELRDLEEELREKDFVERPDFEWKLISVYKAMLRQMERDDVVQPYITGKVIDHLIRYGTYMKSRRDQDLRVAKMAMKEVLRYDPSNPIAAYRLGFIAYRNKEYFSAQVQFQNALSSQKDGQGHKYRLTEQQEKNAYLYLINSSLYMAKMTYETMNETFSELPEQLGTYEFPELYERLSTNEHYLESRAFVKETETSVSYCSKEECEKVTWNIPENVIVLYFVGRDAILYFNDEEKILSKQHGYILRYLLKSSTQRHPANRFGNLTTYFTNSRVREVPRNTFIQAIRRLVRKMKEMEIPDVIYAEERENAVRPAYYFDHSLPFMILSRVDESWGESGSDR